MPKAKILIWTVSTITCLLAVATVVMYVQLEQVKEKQEQTTSLLKETKDELKKSNQLVEAGKAEVESLNQELEKVKTEKAETDSALKEEEQKNATLNSSISDLKKKLKDAEARKAQKQKAALASSKSETSGPKSSGTYKKPAPSSKTTAASKQVVQASENKPKGKTLRVEATAYTAYCNGCSGITATGINLRANPGAKVIAVDPRVIPLGSKVYVEGYGTAIAGDTGGAIKGNRIDLFVPSQSKALQFGRRTLNVTVLN